MVIFLILILPDFIRWQFPFLFSVFEHHYEFIDFYIQCSVAIPSLVILMLKLSVQHFSNQSPSSQLLCPLGIFPSVFESLLFSSTENVPNSLCNFFTTNLESVIFF